MTINKPRLAIIGAGNMGRSLIRGLVANNHPTKLLYAADPSPEKLEHLHQAFGIVVSPDNQSAVEKADVVILAVKPQVMASVVKPLATLIQTQRPLVISIAAAVTEAHLQTWLGGKIAIVRSMPNTPALIGCGASALYANTFTSPEQRDLAESILRSVGLTVWLSDENQMDTVTALSGSGPAYFFLLMEALQQAGRDLGLAEETANILALQTAYGSARLALESKESIHELRQQVTSPGGTTERALEVLAKGKFSELLKEAVKAAKKRAHELTESL